GVGLGLKVAVGVAVGLGVKLKVGVGVLVGVGVTLGRDKARKGVTVRGTRAAGGVSAPARSAMVIAITPRAALKKSAVRMFKNQLTRALCKRIT
ncbi:MAG: hypothetical protein CUN49_15570, partial [Candidatus Thermofonsia Clade 1 bacterium]